MTTPPSNDHTPPTAPTNVHTTAVTGTSIGLAWTASTDNVSVTGYNVYDMSTNSRTKLGSVTGNTPSTTLNALAPGS